MNENGVRSTGKMIQSETEERGEEPVPLPICPPQISHRQA